MFVFNILSPFAGGAILLDAFYLAGFVSVLFGLFVFNLRQPEERAKRSTSCEE